MVYSAICRPTAILSNEASRPMAKGESSSENVQNLRSTLRRVAGTRWKQGEHISFVGEVERPRG